MEHSCTCSRGATPKDGPSKVELQCLLLVSSYHWKKSKKQHSHDRRNNIKRKSITCWRNQGEKILSMQRSGIKEIILSSENKKDVIDINEKYLKGLKFHYVEKMSEVIDLSLLKSKVTNPYIK